ncbi:BnaC08g48450D [Brassica napus]|uniref:(rape) hypothetical protein n=1 Tax=Brassica napus TaxID=3708 RepID=A0A078J622_BRANA|nr:unnamed protein product [Brassica napus]CDY58589.1 BnaC08g48450D [Brassica napus]
MNSLVLSLAPKFVNLQTLILRQDKPELEDNAVEAIENHCHELQELHLSKKNQCDGFMSLSYGCPDLRTLDLCGCVLITGHWGYTTALTPSAVQAVYDKFPPLHTCSLVMSGLSVLDVCALCLYPSGSSCGS